MLSCAVCSAPTQDGNLDPRGTYIFSATDIVHSAGPWKEVATVLRFQSGSVVCRPSIRLPNGTLSPAAFSPVPQTATGGPLPPVALLPSQPLPFIVSMVTEQHLPQGDARACFLPAPLDIRTHIIAGSLIDRPHLSMLRR